MRWKFHLIILILKDKIEKKIGKQNKISLKDKKRKISSDYFSEQWNSEGVHSNFSMGFKFFFI